MIRKRQTTIICNVCHGVVAIKKFLRFETVRGFVTLHGDEVHFVENTIPVDIHICNSCWERMQEAVRNAIEKEG